VLLDGFGGIPETDISTTATLKHLCGDIPTKISNQLKDKLLQQAISSTKLGGPYQKQVHTSE
jgi:hypothetical protein